MEAELVGKLGPAAKNIVKEAELALYSAVGYSGEIKGSDVQKAAQSHIDEVVMRQKRWDRKHWQGFDHAYYQMVVVVQDYSVSVRPTPELYALVHEYEKLQSKISCSLNDARIAKRNADPFYQWLDSLKITGDEEKDQIIRKLKNNFGSELALAKFVWDNKPQ